MRYQNENATTNEEEEILLLLPPQQLVLMNEEPRDVNNLSWNRNVHTYEEALLRRNKCVCVRVPFFSSPLLKMLGCNHRNIYKNTYYARVPSRRMSLAKPIWRVGGNTRRWRRTEHDSFKTQNNIEQMPPRMRDRTQWKVARECMRTALKVSLTLMLIYTIYTHQHIYDDIHYLLIDCIIALII